ncbi:hypothetical protein SLA2020_414440 [Shorea laevis]
MGRKKRSSARTKPPSLAPSPSADPSPPDEKMNVIEELERVVSAVRGGDLSTALKLIEDSLSRYPDSAALHSTRGGIHLKAASQTHDSAAKVQHLMSAIDGDRRALQLATELYLLRPLPRPGSLRIGPDRRRRGIRSRRRDRSM